MGMAEKDDLDVGPFAQIPQLQRIQLRVELITVGEKDPVPLSSDYDAFVMIGMVELILMVSYHSALFLLTAILYHLDFSL